MTAAPDRCVAARIILYDDSSADVSVFLLEGDTQSLLAAPPLGSFKEARDFIDTIAAQHDAAVDESKIIIDDQRTEHRGVRPIPGKLN